MTTSTSATSSKKSTQSPIVANPANVPQSLAPVVPAPSLLAKLQSQAPAIATSAQLASAIGSVQGAYQAIQMVFQLLLAVRLA